MTKRYLLAILASSVATMVATTPAGAQATRTWVSGVGDDANPCSRTAPCKTFAGAISKTAAGGEINCLDPGGFGGLTITKSISIVCDYTEGGVLSAGAGVNGFVINALATDTIFLSGLDFNGAGSAQNGVRIIAGGTVHIQNSIIRNYRATNGLGISFQPSGATQLTITDTTIADNGTAATGGGILIQPTGAGGNARATLRGVRIHGNPRTGLLVSTQGNSGGGASVVVDDSQIAGSTTGIQVVVPGGAASARLMLTHSSIANNSGVGLDANGAGVLVRVGDTTITGNAIGVVISNGATINTYGNNRLDGNPAIGAPNNGNFTAPAIPEK